MSLTKTEAEKLFELGFKRPQYADEVYPQDVYEYENSTWIVGGRIVPSSTLLCNEEVYKEGTWIPSMEDLITWLEENHCKYTLSYDGLNYKVEVYDINEKSYKGKGMSADLGLFKVITQMLHELGGAPVQKSYKVIEAEFIKREDL